MVSKLNCSFQGMLFLLQIAVMKLSYCDFFEEQIDFSIGHLAGIYQ